MFYNYSIYRVRKYIIYFDNCKTRKNQGKTSCFKENTIIKRQTALCKIASNKLRRIYKIVSDKLELEIFMIANTSDKKVSFQEINSSYYKGINRKQAQEKADLDPGNLY
jgi:hypothetical protein